MRMTVYGNNATCPEADGACSCFLIEAEGRRILLDMGNGSLAKLQKDVDLAALDLIAISHLHFDHFGDLFCAKYQLESRRACGEAIPRTLAGAWIEIDGKCRRNTAVGSLPSRERGLK